MKEFRLVTESGKVLCGGETYNERGANNIWNYMHGVYEDENGNEELIYIQEV